MGVYPRLFLSPDLEDDQKQRLQAILERALDFNSLLKHDQRRELPEGLFNFLAFRRFRLDGDTEPARGYTVEECEQIYETVQADGYWTAPDGTQFGEPLEKVERRTSLNLQPSTIDSE